jgi:hypothetical protein
MVEERGEQATVAPKGNIQHPDDQVQGWQGRHQGSQKSEHLEYPVGQSGFPESGQHLYSQEFIQQMVSDSTTSNFRRSGSSSTRLSSGALLPGWATNVWAMGASADDVSTLSSLGGVVRTMGTATDALPPGTVATM